MLQHTVREFDQHAQANGGVVDTSRWKALGSRDDVRVFREREAGAMSAALAFALDKSDVLPRGSTVAPLTPPGVLVTGSTRSKVENVMDAVCSTSQQDLALELSFVHHEDVVDCAVLHTIEAPTETDPFHFLGIKYCVRKASGSGMKHQDAVYLEFSGYTQTTRGERLGFHLMHSLELAEFPPLSARNSTRMLQSTRYLYRQHSEDVVEVFMQGNLDISGKLVASDALFGLATLVACAEARRLTQMWRAQQARNDRQEHRKQQSRRASTLECSMCRQKKKLFGGASLAACELCAQIICSRCHTDKKVFEADANGILGKFRKVSCCVLAANKPRSQPEEPHGLIVMSEHMQLDREGSRDRRRRGASSSGSSGPRSRSDSSCPSASSEECSPAPQAHRGSRRHESVASTASTVSSRSYREGLGVPASPMGMDARAHGGQLVYTINDQQAALQLQQQRRQANAVKSSRGLDRGNEQQLTLCEQHRIPLQLSEAPQSRHQQLFLVSRSHRDYALRRVASTGSTLNSSRYNYGTAPSSQPTDLLARMAELNRVAESTYNTTQQNGVCLSQQLRARRKA